MNKYNPQIHHRRSIRLKGYDYSQAGLYYITICCQDRACLFGEIMDRKMILNDAGKMMETQWLNLTTRFPKIILHDFIIMPNHFHAILEISVRATLVVARTEEAILKLEEESESESDSESELEINPELEIEIRSEDPESPLGRPQGIAPTGIAPTGAGFTRNKTVGNIIGAFKSIVTVEYIRGVKSLGWPAFRKRLLQRNYYEHIIRDEGDYKRIADYIVDNPAKWKGNKFHGK